MTAQLNQDGSFEITYGAGAPYTGLNVQAPANLIKDTDSPTFSNFIPRNAELRSRPAFVREIVGPASDNNPMQGIASFLDVNGTWHTVTWTRMNFYQLADGGNPSAPTYSWAAIANSSAIAPGIPVATRSFSFTPITGAQSGINANAIYWTNGNTFLQSWNGTDANVSATNNLAQVTKNIFTWATATVSMGAYHLNELGGHLLMANLVMTDGVSTETYPQRLWWSALNLPNVWDPTVNTNAGFNDFTDVGDTLTGLVCIGIQGYLFRTNGITQIFPTGSGALPFAFDHMWASQNGVGNVYPWSIAQYGPWVCFVDYEQVYTLGINALNPIGGTARDAILTDLANATSKPTATICPAFLLNFVYYGYLISIPLSNGTKHWFYSFEDSNWSPWFTSNTTQTGRAEEVWL